LKKRNIAGAAIAASVLGGIPATVSAQNPYRGTPLCFDNPYSNYAMRCRWPDFAQGLWVYSGLGKYSSWNGHAGFSFTSIGWPFFADVEFQPVSLSLPFTGYTYVYVSNQYCYDSESRPFWAIHRAYVSYSPSNIALKASYQYPTPWFSASYYAGWVGGHEMGHVLGLNHYGQYIPAGGFDAVYIDYTLGLNSDVMRTQSYFYGVHGTPQTNDFQVLDDLYPQFGLSYCS
jgi:hypothetical protein